jgi:hypothetical protein
MGHQQVVDSGDGYLEFDSVAAIDDFNRSPSLSVCGNGPATGINAEQLGVESRLRMIENLVGLTTGNSGQVRYPAAANIGLTLNSFQYSANRISHRIAARSCSWLLRLALKHHIWISSANQSRSYWPNNERVFVSG